jgi:hypothetical protein
MHDDRIVRALAEIERLAGAYGAPAWLAKELWEAWEAGATVEQVAAVTLELWQAQAIRFRRRLRGDDEGQS